MKSRSRDNREELEDGGAELRITFTYFMSHYNLILIIHSCISMYVKSSTTKNESTQDELTDRTSWTAVIQ